MHALPEFVMVGFVDEHEDVREMRITPIGYHYFSWLEYSVATGTTTWYGDNGWANLLASGLTGTWLA